jgi:hypothetical protein
MADVLRGFTRTPPKSEDSVRKLPPEALAHPLSFISQEQLVEIIEPVCVALTSESFHRGQPEWFLGAAPQDSSQLPDQGLAAPLHNPYRKILEHRYPILQRHSVIH